MPDNYALMDFGTFIIMTLSGWTIESSGDGLSAYSSIGTVFTEGTMVGPNAFTQNLAWIRLRDANGISEIVFQRDAYYGIRIKFSASSKFIMGNPSPTKVPSADDEIITSGGGTDEAPEFLIREI